MFELDEQVVQKLRALEKRGRLRRWWDRILQKLKPRPVPTGKAPRILNQPLILLSTSSQAGNEALGRMIANQAPDEAASYRIDPGAVVLPIDTGPHLPSGEYEVTYLDREGHPIRQIKAQLK